MTTYCCCPWVTTRYIFSYPFLLYSTPGLKTQNNLSRNDVSIGNKNELVIVHSRTTKSRNCGKSQWACSKKCNITVIFQQFLRWILTCFFKLFCSRNCDPPLFCEIMGKRVQEWMRHKIFLLSARTAVWSMPVVLTETENENDSANQNYVAKMTLQKWHCKNDAANMML